MAKGKFEQWRTEDGLTLLKGWARDGLKDDQLADKMGINRATLYDWKVKFSDISDALKKGKEVVDYKVENALLEKALSGDTTAQIFWLKNRRPDKWRDRPVADGESDAMDKLDNILKEFRNAVKSKAD